MNRKLACSLLAFGVSLASQGLFAQGAPAAPKPSREDREIDTVRKSLRQQRRHYIAAALPLTSQEAQTFWPVYDQYVSEISPIIDRRFASLKAFAEIQDSMTSEQAVKWIQEIVQQDRDMEDLRLKYISTVALALPGKKVAMFFNLDRRTQMMIDMDLPLKH